MNKCINEYMERKEGWIGNWTHGNEYLDRKELSEEVYLDP